MPIPGKIAPKRKCLAACRPTELLFPSFPARPAYGLVSCMAGCDPVVSLIRAAQRPSSNRGALGLTLSLQAKSSSVGRLELRRPPALLGPVAYLSNCAVPACWKGLQFGCRRRGRRSFVFARIERAQTVVECGPCRAAVFGNEIVISLPKDNNPTHSHPRVQRHHVQSLARKKARKIFAH